ncbi:MAG: 4-hydroxybenzoyl-CoA reductase, partial [Thermodesulfobacteriota bacterium]
MIQYSVVGKRVPRIDALGKVTGKAKYCPDTVLPGMLAGKILRSPFPHARVLGIDTRKAQRLTGVKAVITAKDAPPVERKPEHIFRPVKRILAADRVRYIGEELAAVAAMDEDTASEAL